MGEPLGARLQHAWNAFQGRDRTDSYAYENFGSSSTVKPDRLHLTITNERSIIASVYNRLGIDVSSISIQHVRLDQNGRYLETIDSDFNSCLTLAANADQTARAFIQDVVMSMCDEGCVAIVPVDTTTNPLVTGSWDIQSMRVAKILQWYPAYVRVRVYNERTGNKEDIMLPKNSVAIIENPFYSVMNELNSTLKRLVRKLNILDTIDNQSGSGKLDLIFQLPYQIKNDTKRDQAARRKKDLEDQLFNSKYGIAYTDVTEKVIQLNRPVENNLMKQIEYLTNMLYGQLGMTEAVLNGTADEATMINYYNRAIEPIISALVVAMKWKFLTKTARSQKQSVEFFRDPFKLIPISAVAEISDTFARNEVMTSNELRQVIGMKPSTDPRADELRNSNMPNPSPGGTTPALPAPGGDANAGSDPMADEENSIMEQMFAGIEEDIGKIIDGVGQTEGEGDEE